MSTRDELLDDECTRPGPALDLEEMEINDVSEILCKSGV